MLFGKLAATRNFALSALVLLTLTLPARAQIGYFLTGAGPINRSMAGAAVGAPIDGPGALYWNAGAISAIPNSMDIGVELLWPQTRIESQYAANSFGPGIPPVSLSGSNRGDNGIFALPTMSVIYRPDCSSLTYGLGVFAIGGFGTNYPASTTNPVLTPQAPGGLGFGPIYSELQLIQLAPTVSWQITDRLSIGVGPTLTLGRLAVDPLFGTAPNDANGDGFSTYPGGTHTRVAWGGGFQVGALYCFDGGWNLGASFKSPQWLEPFHFQSVDELGRPSNATFHLDVPMIVSVGVGYTGFERWVFAGDFRWVDYDSANGTRQGGFDANGTTRGVGWRSVFAMALGAQYRLTDNLLVRAGYSFNDNPIDNHETSFNVASPTVIQHILSVGLSYRVTDALFLSAAYSHMFDNSIDGPLVAPFGTVPGATIRSSASADSFLLGATVYFGARN